MKLYYSIEVFKLENFILLTKKLNNEIIDVKGKVVNLNAYEKETQFGKMLFKDVQIIYKFGCVIFVTFKNKLHNNCYYFFYFFSSSFFINFNFNT